MATCSRHLFSALLFFGFESALSNSSMPQQRPHEDGEETNTGKNTDLNRDEEDLISLRVATFFRTTTRNYGAPTPQKKKEPEQ